MTVPAIQERDLLIANRRAVVEDRRHVAALVESLRKKASEEQEDG